jgi:hypothetical protein
MQRGTISKRGRHWVLRFWEFQIRDGANVVSTSTKASADWSGLPG